MQRIANTYEKDKNPNKGYSEIDAKRW